MRIFIICVVLALSGCALLPEPYHVEIHQGNLTDHKQVEQLKVGMSPAQVEFLLGTPVLADVFHANRWDYIVMPDAKSPGDAERITVWFEGERVSRIERLGGSVK